jgi:hypothetical protein
LIPVSTGDGLVNNGAFIKTVRCQAEEFVRAAAGEQLRETRAMTFPLDVVREAGGAEEIENFAQQDEAHVSLKK